MADTLLQPIIVLSFVYAGIAGGILYDIARFFRRLFCNRIIDACWDLCFVLCAGFTFVITLLLTTGGAIRLYVILAYITGFALQQISLSRIVFYLFYSIQFSLKKNRKT